MLAIAEASPVQGALPGTVYFVHKYAGNFSAALAANAMVGGDSSARALPIGMIMGGEGRTGIPPSWLSQLKSRQQVEALMGEIMRHRESMDQDVYVGNTGSK